MRRSCRLILIAPIALVGACAGRVPDDVQSLAETGDAAMVVAVDCADETAAAIVSIRDERFSPAATTIAPGDVVRFDNDDAIAHTTSSWAIRRGEVAEQAPFWDEAIPAGEQRCLRFDEPGDYMYLCALHPEDEQGTIIVDDGTPNTGGDSDDNGGIDVGEGTIGRERSLEG